MMTKQRLPLLTTAMLLLGFVLPAAAAAPPAPVPPKGEKAGSITALLPVAHIERGAGKAKVTTDAKKGDEIVWNDHILTERGGRARITLNDQSILSLGSQADLRIVKHDARTQQTALTMTYGRVRAEVAKVTRQGGSFELRTPTAVAGVIGTDFGTDASTVGETTFLCISGLVQVSNSDPNIAGSVQCAPGLTTTVSAGKAPTPPVNATPEQIQQLMQDTEPAIISAMSPLSGLPGIEVDAVITGTKLAGVKSVSSTGSGVTTSLVGTPQDNSVTVHIAVAPDAQPGPRMITLSKSSGAASAALFTILAPPTASQNGDYKKPYLDFIGQEGQTTAGGLSAYLAQLQQVADQAIQQLQQANTINLNLNDANNQFASQIAVVQNAINTATAQINEAVNQTTTSFQTQYDAAFAALLQRHPDGTPDDQFNQQIKSIFDSLNGSLGNTFTAIRSNLNSVLTSANTNIAETQQTWLSQITASSTVPVPAVNSSERSIDSGAAFGGPGVAALDASNSKAASGASIVSYKWVLCDPSYKPAQTGIPLAAAGTAGCNAISGFQSSSSDFQFQTCTLQPNDYVARVTVTDSNNLSASMDVKVHILAGSYDDPATRVRSLAQAYTSLTTTNFLSFFDETGFAGYTSLSENVRNTFPQLASMQINPRVSQAAITCNEATVRADWVQNYTYKQNPNISFSQTEQLSMRMLRTPGKGWFITDFQGDNGTVQGQLPGPVVTDSAVADLDTTGLYPTGNPNAQANTPVPPGLQNFTAVITNTGSASFTATTTVRFELLKSDGTPLDSPVTVEVPLPTPLDASQQVSVTADLAVPVQAVGTPYKVSAKVNPNCVGEANCTFNTKTLDLVLGTPVTLTQVNSLTLDSNDPSIANPVGGTVQVQVSAATDVTITLPTGLALANAPGNTATRTATAGQTISWSIYATTAAQAGANLQNITITANAFVPVTLSYVYSLNGVANYVIQSIGFAGHSAPFTGANAPQLNETTSVVALVQNVGNGSPAGNVTLTAICTPVNPNDTTSCSGGGNPTVTIAAPTAGQVVTANLPVDFNGMIPGAFTGTVALTTALPQSNTADDTGTVAFDVSDFQMTIVNAPGSPQNLLPGTSQNVTVQVTTVGTTAFPIPLSASGGQTGVTYTPTTVNVNNATQIFQVAAAGNTAAGSFVAQIVGANHGVNRTAVQAVDVIAPTIVPTNLFLNDASNPLAIQIGSASPQVVSLKLSGAAFSGSATIIPPATGGGFTTTITPTNTVLANGTFDLNVVATSNTGIVTPLLVTVQIPNTSPVLSITYTLFVKAVGSPDLQVVSATPSISFSASSPWLDGQGVDFAVTIQNNGGVASSGNELVHLDINGIPAGSTTLGSPLAAGASRQVTLHAVAPDIHGSSTFSGTVAMKVKVDPDYLGDTNYTNNSLSTSVAMANWHFAVSGSGDSASNTLYMHTDRTPPYTNQVSFAGTVDGGSIGSYSQSLFAPVVGQTSTAITVGNFNASGTGSFTADVTLTDGTVQSGPYFAQVIVQMNDGGVVTAQRQATVYIDVATGISYQVAASLTSSANNCTGTGCNGANGTAVQINGGLAEQVSVTMNLTCFTVGIAGLIPFPCSGTADLAVHDAINTETTPLGSTKGLATDTPLVLRVAAAMDPNGNITTGSASGYAIGINAVNVAVAAAKRGSTPSPDPVGTQVQMLYNVGDLTISANTGANSCTGVVANGSPLQLNVTWQTSGGFNSPSLSWQWETSTHSPVGASPLSFSSASGTSTFSGNGYSPSPSFTISNIAPQDGVLTYFLAVTISNGTSTATKYFPFYFDASLGQNFCGAVSSARGFNHIQGTWSRSAAGFGGPIALSSTARTTVTEAGIADVHISASDVSFTPSMPKAGDTVQLQFRMRNDGTGNATGVPIAFQINGATVASDTFDVPAGRTVLGGLSWTASAPGLERPTRVAGRYVSPESGETTYAGAKQLSAALVVDPLHVTRQKTSLDKSAAIAHFSVRPAGTTATAFAPSSQRILIELEDGACVGLRLSSGGTMPCGNADLEITVGDLAKSLLSMETLAGVGDIGSAFEGRRTDRAAVRYNAQAPGVSGHIYSVQLANGGTAMVNVESIRNPAELDAKARAVFRASAARILRNLGDSSGAAAPGDLTGVDSHATVFIILNVQGQ